jgi:hypothetical protein
MLQYIGAKFDSTLNLEQMPVGEPCFGIRAILPPTRAASR